MIEEKERLILILVEKQGFKYFATWWVISTSNVSTINSDDIQEMKEHFSSEETLTTCLHI